MMGAAAMAVNVSHALGETSAGFALSYSAIRFLLVIEYVRIGRRLPSTKPLTERYSVTENNHVVVFLNGSGTHRGEFHGFPPTNKSVSIRSADLYRIESGVITGHWDVVDQSNLLRQTGALLSQAAD
jgi:hypothetical protein